MDKFEKISVNTKIELSRILETIEIAKNKKEVSKFLDEFYKKSKGHVIGITGPPGVGKSSLINNLINNLRSLKFSVGSKDLMP